MAKVIPDSALYQDTGSDAEVAVYQSLKESLPDNWTIIHSFRWVEVEPLTGRKAQGEGDFIIIHPVKGILVIEVKGGSISYRDRVWYSVDYYGNEHRIQDPEKQANDTKFEIIRRLIKKEIKCFVCHAIWFPDTEIQDVRFPSHLDNNIVLDSNSLDNPLPHIEKIYSFWQERSRFHVEELQQDEIDQIIQYLNPEFRLVKTLKRWCDEVNHLYVRLNDEQFRLLELLETCKEVSVSGRAGTGKTLLAIEKARKDAKKGLKVLFLCYNSELAKHIRDDIGNLANVNTIHSFALDYMEKHHTSRVLGFREDPDFEYLMQEFIEVVSESKEKFDSIIIDEAQDFHESWINSARNLLQNRGSLYTFYDPYQHLYSPKSKIDDSYLAIGTPVLLKRNMRNTDEISKSCLNIISQPIDPDYFSGVSGKPPDVIICEEKKNVDQALRSVIHDLQYIQRIDEEKITVITLTSIDSSCLNQETKDTLPQLTTVRKFKGLENDIVIIVDANLSHIDDPVRQRSLYVALSRARVYSVIIVYLDKLYKEHLLEKWSCNKEYLPELVKKYILEGIIV